MTPDVVRRLCTPDGRALVAEAAALAAASANDDLAVLSTLRRTADADLAAAALVQVRLLPKAQEKLGTDAARLVLLPDSLEQATRREVADHRARTAFGRGVRRAVDAGAGLGADSIAMARAGISVTAVERDPTVVQALQANVRALELDESVTVVEGDAVDYVDKLSPGTTVFADPARRAGGRRVFDPEQADPPLSWLVALAGRGYDVVAKMSPSLRGNQIPDGWEGAWASTRTSGGRSVVEASLWSPGLARSPRRAVVLEDESAVELCGAADGELPIGEVSTYIYEPDGAVNQAELVAQIIERSVGWLLSPRIGYLSSDRLAGDVPAKAYRVLETVPWSARKVGAALTKYDARDLVVKKRGIELDPQRMRREWLGRLGGRDGDPLTVIVVRRTRDTLAIIAQAL